MEERYCLLIFSACWADEFDCEGFTIMSEADWEKLKNQVKAYFSENPGAEIELGFGTNEELCVESFEDWIKDIQVRDIDKDTARMLVELFEGPDADEEDIQAYFVRDEDGYRPWFSHGTGSSAMFEQISEHTDPELVED